MHDLAALNRAVCNVNAALADFNQINAQGNADPYSLQTAWDKLHAAIIRRNQLRQKLFENYREEMV